MFEIEQQRHWQNATSSKLHAHNIWVFLLLWRRLCDFITVALLQRQVLCVLPSCCMLGKHFRNHFNFRFRFRMFFVRTVWKHLLFAPIITNLSSIFFESWVFSFSRNHNLKKGTQFRHDLHYCRSDFFRISYRIILWSHRDLQNFLHGYWLTSSLVIVPIFAPFVIFVILVTLPLRTISYIGTISIVFWNKIAWLFKFALCVFE